MRRLQIQDNIGELGTDLEANEWDTFAELWLQHEPEYRIVVAFTRDSKETVRPYVEGGPLEDVVEVREASATLVELQESQKRAHELVRGLGIRADSAIDVKQNRAELYVTNRARLEFSLQQANVRLPEHVAIVEVEGLAEPE